MNYFNQNVCPYCNTKLHNFNTSNQNQNSYTRYLILLKPFILMLKNLK